MTSKIVVNNIEADAGVSTVTFGSEISASTFNGNIVGTSATFSGNVNVAGVLTYEDVTSVDAVGLSTFQNGIHVTGGSVGIGTDNPAAELEVYGNARFKDIDGSHGIEFYPDVASLGYQRIISYNRTTSAYENLSIGVNDFIVTNGSTSERLRITSSGDVGIGTTNPQRLLHLYSSSNNPLLIESPDQFADIVQADTGGSTRLRSDQGGFRFYTGGDASSVQALNATERLSITSSGDVNVASGSSVFIGNGNLVFSTSGTGIDFSATSDVAGMTSELLDDYEEGTFQPSIGNGFSSVSYQIRAGRYIKIGRYVHIDFYLRFGTGSAANGQHIYIDDLPYVLSADTYGSPGGQWTRGGGTNSFQNLSIADGLITFYGASTQNRITTYYSGGNAWGTNVANANGLYIIGAFNYITD